MEPMTMMAVASVAAPVIGGIFGSNAAKKGRQQQAEMSRRAYAELEALGIPPDLSKALILREFQSQGMLTPEMEQEVSLQASQVGQIQEDPRMKEAQMEALGQMQQASRTGLTVADRAAFNEMNRSAQQAQTANRQALMQQMQARGQGGSGAELMAQLAGQQGGVDQASAQADRIAAQASINRLAAGRDYGQMAGSVRGQDFSQAETMARAQDQRAQYLHANSANLQQRNIGSRNEAQRANLANAQRLSEMNVSQGNQELQRQNQAKRDYFSDKFGLAQAKAAALGGQGQAAAQSGQASADRWSGIGSAVGQGFATFGKSEADKEAARLLAAKK